ncbi:hypothetical protein OOK41_00120 [Micromonospora sp. NBC_01655]|uniref:hypothetical protein n=1 Tax=Micromonospora sp. NBC_01655 TaxID=2975983 RepID=UPI002253231D|nr:hypothetical protein [Micromonospora sp. NBC_01655]MCX4468736.1 hypothetical protein [Micromonospora sp. NBC_01655]
MITVEGREWGTALAEAWAPTSPSPWSPWRDHRGLGGAPATAPLDEAAAIEHIPEPRRADGLVGTAAA